MSQSGFLNQLFSVLQPRICKGGRVSSLNKTACCCASWSGSGRETLLFFGFAHVFDGIFETRFLWSWHDWSFAVSEMFAGEMEEWDEAMNEREEGASKWKMMQEDK